MTTLSISRAVATACAVAILSGGCFKEDRFAEPNDGGSGSSPPPPAAVNRAPTISGNPMTSLRVGESYDFRPSAADPDGDTLTYTIENAPDWVTFDPSNGRLQGTPDAGDVGQFSAVRIHVSDGRLQASLNAFSISVNQVATGNVTLSWSPPTTNADGTALTNLAGYRIHYGRSAGTLDTTIVISNPGTIRWVIENLSPATWYFSMSSYNANGIESTRSGVVSRTLT